MVGFYNAYSSFWTVLGKMMPGIPLLEILQYEKKHLAIKVLSLYALGD